MPVISVEKNCLFKSLGREYTEQQFDELCFDFGIELDDVVEEEGKELYKIDLPANRVDLLSLEGLSRSLLIFQNKREIPDFKALTPNSPLTIKVIDSKKSRPFIVGAVLRNIDLTDKSRLDSLLQLQDHLHRNICRRRTLVAIGTHDLDSFDASKPVEYRFVDPKSRSFRPLFLNDKEMTLEECVEEFSNNVDFKHMKEFCPLVKKDPSGMVPCVLDGDGNVLSLPPLINGEMSKITASTKNVFIECTATDLTKAHVVLNTLCASFFDCCERVEKVKILNLDGDQDESEMTPKMEISQTKVKVEYINSILGLQLSTEEICSLLRKMQLNGIGSKDNDDEITVDIPITRSDVLHPCDVVEDVAIAIGYNNLTQSLPKSHEAGLEQTLNVLTDVCRQDLARQGFTELMTFALCGRDEAFKNLKRESLLPKEAVILSNPKTIEFQVVRNSLLPGALKTLCENKNLSFAQSGIRLFECSDIVKLTSSFECKDNDDLITLEERDVGSKNERHCVVLRAGSQSGLEHTHGVLDRLMQSLNVLPHNESLRNKYGLNQLKNDAHLGFFKLESFDCDTYLKGTCAKIMARLKNDDKEDFFTCVGEIGVLHPEVLHSFKLVLPCSVFEVNLQFFL